MTAGEIIREELVMVCTSDISGQVRGKGFPLPDLAQRLLRGVGWTPTNLMLTAFGPIADSPWGPFGDVLLLPDPATEVRVDYADGSAVEHFFLADILETDGKPWPACPRHFLKEALAALGREAGLRVKSAFEHEFYYAGADERPGTAYSLDAVRRHDLFAEVFLAALRQAGLECDSYLPEYGPRQYEVTYSPSIGVTAADHAVILRELARATARRLGHGISFSPVVTPDVVGNGVHIHMSLVDAEDRPVAYDPAHPQGLSETAGRFAAGILKHLPAICAVTAPSVVSYLRLVPHRWSAAWTNLGYRNREATLRICPVSTVGGGEPARQYNLEFRAADATASPYLALGMLVRAGLEGLKHKLPPATITGGDPDTLSKAEREKLGIVRLPQSLEQALAALEADLVACGWFSPLLLDAYLRYKRTEIALMKDLDRDQRCARYAQAY